MKNWSRRRFLGTTLGAATLGLAADQVHEGQKVHQMGATLWGQENRASLSVPDVSNIRLLQVTDLHLGLDPWDRQADQQTVADIDWYIRQTNPHLVLVTGDLWNDNPFHLGQSRLERALLSVSQWQVPWLFVWGNHDCLDNYAKGHQYLSQASGSLYRGGPGAGNYQVDLLGPDGKMCWQLLCLNSMEVGLGQPALDWLAAQEAASVGRWAIFHIPLMQYADQWSGPQSRGVQFEPVTYAQERGHLLPRLQQLGVSLCMCGHDHVNDYSATWKNIELVYGRASGHSAYGAEAVPKGAKLYQLDAQARTWQWWSLTRDGVRWSPPAGSRRNGFHPDWWKA